MEVTLINLEKYFKAIQTGHDTHEPLPISATDAKLNHVPFSNVTVTLLPSDMDLLRRKSKYQSSFDVAHVGCGLVNVIDKLSEFMKHDAKLYVESSK